jgi:hypothetical protein
MSRKSISTSSGEPSFFYLMMAGTCFQRAASARHPRAGTLRDIARNYLTKATEVTSTLEPQPPYLAPLESASWARHDFK